MAENQTSQTDEKQPAPQPGTDPLAAQDAARSDDAARGKISADIEQSMEKAKEARARDEAERIAAGFAPSYNPADPRKREEIERDAKKALGLEPAEQQKARAGGSSYQAKSSREVAEELERLRSGPNVPYQETRTVTVDGTRHLVPTGREVNVPDEVKDVLEQADRPIRTSQMLGGTDGVPTIDYTQDESPDEPTSPPRPATSTRR